MKRSASIFKDLLSEARDKHESRNRLVFWISLILAAALLFLALRGIDWVVLFTFLRDADYLYVALLVVWSTLTYFFRAMRWRVLLSSQKNILLINVFWANMAGYLGNNILPARAGEFIRAAYIARKEDISLAFALATGITERLVDLATLVTIAAASLFFVDAFPKPVQEVLKGFSVAAVAGVVFIFTLPLFHNLINRFFFSLPFLNQLLKSKLREVLRQFVEGVKTIARLESSLSFLLFTALIWLMDGIGMVVLALSLHESLTLAQSFLLIASLGLSSAIPSTPGYVGVYQFVAMTVLVPFGFARESALALILLVQALNLVVVACCGGTGLWVGSRGISTIQTKKTEGEMHG